MELIRALAALAEPPTPEHARLAEVLDLPRAPDDATFTEVFVMHLYPYASVYLGAEGMLGGAARDRVAGFLRALDATPPAEPDHLTVLLTAYTELRDADTPAGEHARQALLWEHLLPWLPLYLDRVHRLAPEPYRTWAALLDRVLYDEAADLPGDRPQPLHLRQAPELADPRDGDQADFVQALLAPARTGFILTGGDLVRAARDLGLAARIGERRYVLENLIGQDAEATLRWLARHVTTTHDAWEGWDDIAAPIADHWRRQADRTARLLDDLADEAAGAEIVVTA